MVLRIWPCGLGIAPERIFRGANLIKEPRRQRLNPVPYLHHQRPRLPAPAPETQRPPARKRLA